MSNGDEIINFFLSTYKILNTFKGYLMFTADLQNSS